MRAYVEPLKLLICDNEASKGVKAERIFGGFCECGGIMFQKSWHLINGRKLLVSECDKCWKVKAYAFSGLDLVDTFEVKTYTRANLLDLLRELLSEAEFNAVVEKFNGGNYNYSALSRAKKKLENLGVDFEELISHLF